MLSFVVALHQMLNEMNKIKCVLFFDPTCLTCYCRDQEYVAGDQLQGDVKQWLSPPDPSTNHIFVSKARHNETATWFIGSDALKEWKETGSFLWIHGKRMFFEPSASALH